MPTFHVEVKVEISYSVRDVKENLDLVLNLGMYSLGIEPSGYTWGVLPTDHFMAKCFWKEIVVYNWLKLSCY